MKHQDWQRHSRDDPLSADSDDASLSVQTWLHRRQRARANPLRRFANVFGVLAVFAFSFYLLAEYNGFGDLLKAKTNGLLNPSAPAIALPFIDLDAPALRQIEPHQPDTLTNVPLAIPKPLADCIDTANLIDENVIACRYGTLPRDQRPAPSSGMVSAQYLAHYKAEQANRSSVPATRNVSHDVDRLWIKGWGGDTPYLAEWHSLDNRIDSSSVCLNHRCGSIDYRECRKAAKVHFREQCRAWEKRWVRDRLEWSQQMEQRYCSAANGFSQMG